MDSPSFDQVIDRGWVRSSSGEQLPVIGSVSKNEAHVLRELIVENSFTRGIETGIARGISTLALAEGFRETGGKFCGFDPCQDSDHQDAALETLKEFSLDSFFELHRQPGQSGIPTLPDKEPFDFVFIDDLHNFHHRFATFYNADQRLLVGGMIAFHDLWLPSMKKLLRCVNTLGTYELVPTPAAQPATLTKLRRLLGALVHRKPYALWWPNGFSNLLILRKTGEFEEDFLRFQNF